MPDTFTCPQYAIERITFSLEPETTPASQYPSPNSDQELPGDYMGSTRDTWLTAHFTVVLGLDQDTVDNATDSKGCCKLSLETYDTIGIAVQYKKAYTLVFDKDGNVESGTGIDISEITALTRQDIVDDCTEKIEQEIKNYILRENERYIGRKALHEIEQVEGISQVY